MSLSPKHTQITTFTVLKETWLVKHAPTKNTKLPVNVLTLKYGHVAADIRMQQWAGRVRSGIDCTAETKPSNSMIHLLQKNTIQHKISLLFSCKITLQCLSSRSSCTSIKKVLRCIHTHNQQWSIRLPVKSGYCTSQVRIILSANSNPLPPFLWTLLKRLQTLTLYFDRPREDSTIYRGVDKLRQD